MNLGMVTSFIVGGILLLSILQLDARVLNNTHNSTFDIVAKNNMVGLSSVISFDMRKVGYGTSDEAFLTAASNELSFQGDIDNDGTVDTVTWTYDTTAAVSGTKNPGDYELTRTVNGSSMDMSAVITGLTWTYFDSTGNETHVLSYIQSLKVELICQSPEMVNGDYTQSAWERSFYPVNK